MKRILSVALAVLLLMSVCAPALAAPIQLSAADADNQINFIYSQLSTMKQSEDKKAWNYAVTDLDHNGQLELVAASEHDRDHSTTLMVWEVNKNVDTMVKCVVQTDGEFDSFPDIMAESADTFFDSKTDTWHYLFFDNLILSDREAYSLKCSVTMKNRTLSYEQYALMHVVSDNGSQTVNYMDMKGNTITEDAFNAAGVSAFPQQSRSSTNFDWFAYDEVSPTRLADSYAIFTGEKQPAKSAPAQKQSTAQFLMITKNPTNEYHNVGETAWFVAGANNWDSLYWTFVGPNGIEDSPENFLSGSGAGISGAYGTTLSISNLEAWMDGWGVYCTFRYNGQTARTSTAWLSVKNNPQPTPGQMSGTVTDAMMSTVTIALDNGTTVQPLRDICTVSGELKVGCRADVYYNGNQPTTQNLTYVYIYGGDPGPSYGCMGGTISDASMNYFTVNLDQGGSVYVSQQLAVMVYGDMTIGCRCDVLYYGDYPSDDNVYEVDVYGSEDPPEPPTPPEPVQGSMGGTAHEGGGGYAIDLDDGSQVYVDAWKCNVEGQFYDGCSAVVYYNDYPSSDNIYAADIYGNQGLIIPDDEVLDEDQGGFAGSNYYTSTIGDEDFGYWDDNGEWVLYGDNG